jgi:hypothetical protein
MTIRTCRLARVVLLPVLLLLAGAADGHAQTARTRPLMQEKLAHAQHILAALTTSNYGLLLKETQALQRLTQSPQWSELMTAELRPYTSGFVKALGDLAGAADRRDYDAAGTGYSALVAACISCHKHVMNSRIARAP